MSKLATEFYRAEDSPGFLLWQLSNKWQARQRAALQPFGLTHVQFVLLATITFAAGKHSFTQKQLAAHARTDMMMASQVLRKLEQKGLVHRKRHSSDGRALALEPTSSGIALANHAIKAVEAVDRDFFAAAGSNLPTLIKTMQRLT